MRLGMLIDVTRCSGCHNCFLACRDEHYGNEYPGYSAAQPLNGQFWMPVKEVEGGKYPRPRLNYIAIPCQHCQNAPCTDAAKDGAVYRREDGVVMIDPETGMQTQVNTSNPNLRMGYAKLMSRQQEGVTAGFRKHGIDFADLRTDGDTLAELHRLLKSNNEMTAEIHRLTVARAATPER